MMFKETIAVYCENNTKYTNKVCKHSSEFCYGNGGGMNIESLEFEWVISFSVL
jgi:hypothetical protein